MRSCAWIFLCSGVLFTFIAWSANSDLNELNARRKSSTLANLRRHKPDPSDDWRIEEFVVCPKFMRLANADFDFGDEYWIPIYPGVDGEPPPKDEEIREILYLIGVNSSTNFSNSPAAKQSMSRSARRSQMTIRRPSPICEITTTRT